MHRPLPAADLQHVIAIDEQSLYQFQDKHLFITGATGFFGKWLLESLLHANDQLALSLQITALSRQPQVFAKAMPHLAGHRALKLLQGDVLDFEFPNGNFTHIIHAATQASASLNQENPLAMFDTVVQGTRRVLDFAVAQNIKNVLLTSSGAVYGTQPPEYSHIPEDFLGGPITHASGSAYAEGKRAAETLCAIYAEQYGLQPRIARCFAFVGPHLPLDTHFAIGNFMRDVLARQDIVVRGDGSPYRSYLHAADLMVWLLKILADGKPLHPYNVGSNEAIDIASLADLVTRLSAGTSKVKIMAPRSSLPPARYVPDIKRAENELGLRVQIPLSDSITRTLTWLQQSLHS